MEEYFHAKYVLGYIIESLTGQAKKNKKGFSHEQDVNVKIKKNRKR